MEIEKQEEKKDISHLENAWFAHRKEINHKVNNARKAMAELLRVTGEEHSFYALTDYDHDDMSKENIAIHKAHREYLERIESEVKEIQEKWWGRENYRGTREGGLKQSLNQIDYGVCPDCGGFTESDGDREADGCSADWALWERTWSWCIGFGSETEFTGDCCGLTRRQQERNTDAQRATDIKEYSKWLLFGGMSTVHRAWSSYEMRWIPRIEREYRLEAMKVVDEMFGIVRTSDYWVEFTEYWQRNKGVFNYYFNDGHDENCVHREGCGWSTSSQRVVQSGGWY